jgi:DNA-binding NarL/FixJ family response regulator
MARPRLLLADDHKLLLDGLRKLLEADFELVGTVSDGRAAVTAYRQLQPDLVLMDMGLPLLNGIEAARKLRATANSNPTDWFAGRLTPRQREVLQLVVEGISMKEIAQIPQSYLRTVEYHKNGIMDELRVRTTAELTRYAMTHGISNS